MRERRRFTEIVSAAAVVISLVFVGLEVRESARQTELNTQSLQVSTYQDLATSIAGLNTVMLENPGMRQRLAENYPSSWAELSTDEQGELAALAFLLLRHGDLAFYQYQIGMLSEERLDSAIAPIRGQLFCRRAFRTFWDAQRDNFTEDYQHFVSERLSEYERC